MGERRGGHLVTLRALGSLDARARSLCQFYDGRCIYHRIGACVCADAGFWLLFTRGLLLMRGKVPSLICLSF